MMGEHQDSQYRPEDAKAAAESLKKEALGQGSSGPAVPEWSLQIISHDDEVVDFDGFNLNYNEAKGALITFELPVLVTGNQP